MRANYLPMDSSNQIGFLAKKHHIWNKSLVHIKEEVMDNGLDEGNTCIFYCGFSCVKLWLLAHLLVCEF